MSHAGIVDWPGSPLTTEVPRKVSEASTRDVGVELTVVLDSGGGDRLVSEVPLELIGSCTDAADGSAAILERRARGVVRVSQALAFKGSKIEVAAVHVEARKEGHESIHEEVDVNSKSWLVVDTDLGRGEGAERIGKRCITTVG